MPHRGSDVRIVDNAAVGPSALVMRRRQLLQAVAGTAVAGALPGLVSACANPAPPVPTASTSAPAASATSAPAPLASGLPAYTPAPNRPPPDFASSGPLSEDAYVNYPRN